MILEVVLNFMKGSVCTAESFLESLYCQTLLAEAQHTPARGVQWSGLHQFFERVRTKNQNPHKQASV